MRFLGQYVSALVLGGLALACGGSSSSGPAGGSQDTARDQAVAASCNKARQCNQIGDNKTYASDKVCDANQTTFWQQAWPAKDCDGHIDAQQLQLCLDTINAAECGNTGDLLNIIANKCPATKVCGA